MPLTILEEKPYHYTSRVLNTITECARRLQCKNNNNEISQSQFLHVPFGVTLWQKHTLTLAMLAMFKLW